MYKYVCCRVKGELGLKDQLRSPNQHLHHPNFYHNIFMIIKSLNFEKSSGKQRNESEKNLTNEIIFTFAQMDEIEKIKGDGLIITLSIE